MNLRRLRSWDSWQWEKHRPLSWSYPEVGCCCTSWSAWQTWAGPAAHTREINRSRANTETGTCNGSTSIQNSRSLSGGSTTQVQLHLLRQGKPRWQSSQYWRLNWSWGSVLGQQLWRLCPGEWSRKHTKNNCLSSCSCIYGMSSLSHRGPLLEHPWSQPPARRMPRLRPPWWSYWWLLLRWSKLAGQHRQRWCSSPRSSHPTTSCPNTARCADYTHSPW